MLNWIEQNLGTIAITAVLIVIVASIIVYEIRQKKRGKNSCAAALSQKISLGIVRHSADHAPAFPVFLG